MAVLKMQRLAICAWKKNRKQILELLQRRGVLDIDTDAAEDEVFKKTDTSEARGDFERDIQLIEHALEILQQYVPEQKSLFSSLEGKDLVDLEEYRRIEAARETVLEKARKIEALSRETAEGETEIRKLENEREALEPWKSLPVPMNFTGTKRTKALIGAFPEMMTSEQLGEKVERCLLPEQDRDGELPGYFAEVVSADKMCIRDSIYIGRLEKLKGIRLLLEAWRELPEAPLILCGSGPEEEWVKSYLEENHMEQVKLMGQLSHEEVMRHLAESKALILPTLCYEGQPMVILESYAAGTPVLASDLGNAGNMVIPEVTGFRFAPGDPAAIREAVKKMEQTESWDTQSVYERFYTPEKNYEILKNIYDRVGKD